MCLVDHYEQKCVAVQPSPHNMSLCLITVLWIVCVLIHSCNHTNFDVMWSAQTSPSWLAITWLHICKSTGLRFGIQMWVYAQMNKRNSKQVDSNWKTHFSLKIDRVLNLPVVFSWVKIMNPYWTLNHTQRTVHCYLYAWLLQLCCLEKHT